MPARQRGCEALETGRGTLTARPGSAPRAHRSRQTAVAVTSVDCTSAGGRSGSSGQFAFGVTGRGGRDERDRSQIDSAWNSPLFLRGYQFPYGRREGQRTQISSSKVVAVTATRPPPPSEVSRPRCTASFRLFDATGVQPRLASTSPAKRARSRTVSNKRRGCNPKCVSAG
jgi:hypothetical protein